MCEQILRRNRSEISIYGLTNANFISELLFPPSYKNGHWIFDTCRTLHQIKAKFN